MTATTRKTGFSLPAWAVLTVIALCAALLLSVTYQATKDVIAARAQADAAAARLALLPEADRFEAVDAPDGLTEVYRALNERGETAGFIAVLAVNGFGGEIEVTVGIDTAGCLTGVRVGGTQFSETPGLGAKAREAAFTDQFVGLAAPVALSKDGGTVDAVTSATITSRAIVLAVNTAADALRPLLQPVSAP
ncbi:MAG: RnfABCDGE type electron transport complex subunit G [Clostridiales bacterium]|nr:RnfABCDGE type electron transport complex subunit G [Clostridiales bacterium]